MPTVVESGQCAQPPARGKGRRWPFRARNPQEQVEINARISQIISGIEDMIYKLVRSRCRSGMDEDAITEIVQRCRIWLWERSLPKYDAYRQVKISTFLYRCASNFINQEVRSIMRQRRAQQRVSVVDPDLMLQTIQASDHRLDDRIHDVAEDVLKHPEKYMTESQVAVFRAIVNNPRAQMKDLARKLGYQRASSLSMMLRRIRERIVEIDIEDHDASGERE